MNETMSAESFHARCREAGVHTVEVAAPDTQGHLRGKRVPVDRFFAHTFCPDEMYLHSLVASGPFATQNAAGGAEPCPRFD